MGFSGAKNGVENNKHNGTDFNQSNQLTRRKCCV